MWRIVCLTLLLINFSNLAFSQWESSDIPDSLKANADVVVRRYLSDYKVESEEKIVIKENVVITILNESGMRYANFNEYYDKNSKIENVKGCIYDGNGKILKKIKRADFKDVSLNSGYSLFDDNRMIESEVIAQAYPFTVEYDYEKVINTAFYLPRWFPQGYRVGVQEASLRVSYKNSNPVRYKFFNIEKPIFEKEGEGFEVLLWGIKNRKPIESEVSSVSSYKLLPSVFLLSSNFTFDNYNGSLLSWNSYGEWLSKLLIGRQNISEKTILEINNLTKEVSDVREKVSIVYKFLQHHSRYVSIQLGIGGFQPFPASDVEKYGYGDCKALTNYMFSLLKAIGIKSNYCEIGVSRSHIEFDDFPEKSQTDHVILCVPIEKDTIWLECTSQDLPFGFISHVKQNQKVVFVDGEKSRLVNMPKANADINYQKRLIRIQIDSVGNVIGKLNTNVFGAECENLMPEVWSSKMEQLEILQKKYRIPSVVFKEYDYKIEELPEIKASESVVFKSNKLISITGKRLFVPFNPLYQNKTAPIKSKKRISDLLIDESYTHFDTLFYSLPQGYKVEFLPKSKSITCKFGEYESSVKVEGDCLITTRKFKQNRAQYPAGEFNNYVDFLSEVYKNDKQQIVLVKI